MIGETQTNVQVLSLRNVQVSPTIKNEKSKHSDNSHSRENYKLTSHTKHTVLDLFNVCSNHAPLNYSGQESKTKSQFMILIYL